MIRCRVADMSESLLCCSALICLEICLHLLSRLAPISVAVVPHWERQATGFSQTWRWAELPNHIPSLPTTVSISLLSSQPPLHIQCWKQAFWGRLRWWFSWSLPGTLSFPQEKLRPPLSDAHNCWLCLFLTFSGFTSQLFRATNPPCVFSSENLHAALMHHGNLRLIVLSH